MVLFFFQDLTCKREERESKENVKVVCWSFSWRKFVAVMKAGGREVTDMKSIKITHQLTSQLLIATFPLLLPLLPQKA